MKVFVMVPTYNEKENIASLIREIFRQKIKNLEIVVADDYSPDGTWKIVQKMVRKNKKVHLLLRKRNKGRGLAGRDGFIECLDRGADVVVEMDSDFSHHPKYIPRMIKELKNADLILGSRRVKDGEDVGRGLFRKFVTWGASLYINILLGLKVKDCNSGFRCYKRKVLEGIKVKKLTAKGPDIVQEVLFKAHLKGFKIKEIPIRFVNRTKGHSKLTISKLAMGYYIVLKLKFLWMMRRI